MTKKFKEKIVASLEAVRCSLQSAHSTIALVIIPLTIPEYYRKVSLAKLRPAAFLIF